MAKSIKEIAQELNVSKSTVSLVINHKAERARISKGLESRVLAYVEKVGYKPNALAKSLATGRSNTIGLIVENIGDSFLGHLLCMLRNYSEKKGITSSTVVPLEIHKMRGISSIQCWKRRWRGLF
ncbi:LacI family DNA-binding transcriptional regulator [Sphingobacterium sp. R2]|uniref:LacI family DNA-binding transcriptional regulator n=1 Tax=Sphingobacterium sp. R2 TaxID=3112958 RepID=UPI00345C7036